MSEKEGNKHKDDRLLDGKKSGGGDDLNREIFEAMLVVVMVLIASVVGVAIYIRFSAQHLSSEPVYGEFIDIEKIDDRTMKIVFSEIKPEKSISDITFRLETQRGSNYFKFGSDEDGAQVVAFVENNGYTLNYTDQRDNGKVDSENFITIASGSSGSWSSFESGTYIFTMIYDGSAIDEISFSYQ